MQAARFINSIIRQYLVLIIQRKQSCKFSFHATPVNM